MAVVPHVTVMEVYDFQTLWRDLSVTKATSTLFVHLLLKIKWKILWCVIFQIRRWFSIRKCCHCLYAWQISGSVQRRHLPVGISAMSTLNISLVCISVALQIFTLDFRNANNYNKIYSNFGFLSFLCTLVHPSTTQNFCSWWLLYLMVIYNIIHHWLAICKRRISTQSPVWRGWCIPLHNADMSWWSKSILSWNISRYL